MFLTDAHSFLVDIYCLFISLWVSLGCLQFPATKNNALKNKLVRGPLGIFAKLFLECVYMYMELGRLDRRGKKYNFS